jgi:hypothetical protein
MQPILQMLNSKRRIMKTRIIALTTVLTLSVLMGAGMARAQSSDSGAVPILHFTTMFPVSGLYVGSGNPIRGINGGGLPWAISGASGTLFENGMLKVRTHGLVFASGPNTGKNTIPFFRAAVSCLDSSGGTLTLWTQNFRADSMGDANINARVDLPHPCIAPIIFVTAPSPINAWFAVTGN